MIWFTSDHHFGHFNVIKYCARPFDSCLEMDLALMEAWNKVVTPDDTVYHLGDFTLGGIAAMKTYASNLNGTIKIIPGGHDYRWIKDFNSEWAASKSGQKVELLDSLVSIELDEGDDPQYPQVIVLCHYAMRVWDRSHYGAWHLYGHSHGSLQGIGKSMDIGVDTSKFQPYSLEVVSSLMRQKTKETVYRA